MELALDISNLGNTISEKVAELQETFLNSTFGNALNNALDVGIRFLLPDFVEEDVIEIKDAFLENGITEGISKIVETAKDFAKSALGIVSGTFENISQLKLAVEEGGIISTISNLLDSVINKLEEKNILGEDFANLIRNIKNSILDTTSSNLSSDLEEQEKNTEKLEKYIENWKEAYEEQDFESMEKAYTQIQKYLSNTLTTEEIYESSEIIENLHNLIKNNGEDFDLSEEELELAEKLY